MSGVMPGIDRPKLIMGMDIDYPPYAYLRQAPYNSAEGETPDEVAGVGADMIKAMAAFCDFDVEVVQAHWSDCWNNGEIGQGLLQGWYHGCMTYTHAAGVRNRYLEFSNAWAVPNKPAGLITRLVDGAPHLKGSDDLSGKTIVDVTGWAPTADTLYFVKNQCTGEPYAGDFTIVQGDDVDVEGDPMGPNDRALMAVLQGHADAMWIYGDQAANYQCAEGEVQDGYDCDLWAGFGSTFAYAQSGMFAWMHNGTTVAMSKKGAGVAKFLDACLEKFLPSHEFHVVCATEHHDHSQLSTCVPNEFITSDPHYEATNIAHSPYMFPTSAMAAAGRTCSTGYCSCDE